MPSLKALEDDNAKLKKLLAEAEPDKTMLKEIAAKPVLSSSTSRLMYGPPRPVQGNWRLCRDPDLTRISSKSSARRSSCGSVEPSP